MRSIFLFCIVLMTLLACVGEDNVTPAIPFKDIVGNYNGLSKICTAATIEADTTCNSGINNGLKVTIESLTTIRVTDATSHFVNQPLTFQKTEQISGNKYHYFIGQIDLTTLNLNFNENNNEIKFESLVNTDGVIKSDFFIGTKK